jgi:nucleoside diphosphate kinase
LPHPSPLHTNCHTAVDSDSIITKIKESGFEISMREETTLTREMAEQLYSKKADTEYFNDLVSMMTT